MLAKSVLINVLQVQKTDTELFNYDIVSDVVDI